MQDFVHQPYLTAAQHLRQTETQVAGQTAASGAAPLPSLRPVQIPSFEQLPEFVTYNERLPNEGKAYRTPYNNRMNPLENPI